jgi:tetratricopeptide (TPR) repeat protein
VFERDYLMRLIAQTTKAFGAIMGLREQNKQEQAMSLIDEFLARELRLRTRFVMGLSDKDLLAMLSVGGVPNTDSVAILAAFLQEEAELLSDLGRTSEAVPRLEKALRLNLWLLRENDGFDGWDVSARAGRLLELLAPYQCSPETIRAMWLWREHTGAYAEAENLLYELQEHGEIGLSEGLSFYERLASLTDGALEAGNLPREELDEGSRQWALLMKESVG